jgi:pimeloyl-ACP methyl ester carboxylesterase
MPPVGTGTGAAGNPAYEPRAIARHEDLRVRGLRHRVHAWGEPSAPPVLMLHGWADTGMSFQFLADELCGSWRIIAPDWRGFGDSDHCAAGYWIPDYLADLESYLDAYAPGDRARIVGHSMGGNVAWMYAGIRPDRVGWAASLDAFGLPDSDPREAPDRYARWLDQWRESPAFSEYGDLDAVAGRVAERAPRLDPARARFIAACWTRQRADGRLELRHDPAHKRVNPVLYRRAETESCWRRIRARSLLVVGRESPFHERFAGGAGARCRECIPHLEEAAVDAGHMLHLERPREVAALLHDFLSQPAR